MVRYRPRPKAQYALKPRKVPKDIRQGWGKNVKPIGKFKNVKAVELLGNVVIIEDENGRPLKIIRNVKNMTTIGLEVDKNPRIAYPSIKPSKTATIEVYKDPKQKTVIIKKARGE